ncbi:MAG: SAM-dependent methyltransferase [Deltaproteobacteria bacterium]|jgi:predicted O-methyltransferase YrrM|nr:SAM-dependent methyltransferase [Deltaproteobacteria bacterium]
MAYDWTPKKFFSLQQEVWKAKVIQTAVELDLFTVLTRQSHLTVNQLTSELKTDLRATGMLISALASLELLEIDEEKIKLSESAKRYLSKDSSDYFGYIILHQSDILPNWTKLTEAVKTGSPPLTQENKPQDLKVADLAPEETIRNFLLGMFNVAVQQACIVAEALDLKKARRLLDLGGGPGAYSAYFCAKNPHLTAVVFDQPGSEKIATSVLEKLNVHHRVSFMGGDFLTSHLPEGFDALWLSQVLHGENPNDAALLVKRGFSTLNQGAIAAIQEFVLDNDRQGPEGPALFALNMLVQTKGGRVYTLAEIEDMLKEAGAVEIRELKATLPPGTRIILGQKP